MTRKEETLQTALLAVGLQRRGIPRRYREKEDGFWIQAIVLVRKRNLEDCYCLYQRDGRGIMHLIRDFGSASPIISVKSIHPYMYLDEWRFNPCKSPEEQRMFLKTEVADRQELYDKVDTMSDAEVCVAIIDEGIRLQLMNRDADRLANIVCEGCEEDETSRRDVAEAWLDAEVDAMKKDGASPEEIEQFTADFRARFLDKPAQGTSDDTITAEDETREEMERAEEEKNKKAELSRQGEFDEIQRITLEQLRKEMEEFRHERRLASMRKYRRKYDRNRKIRSGCEFENEDGQLEDVETIALPEYSTQEIKKKPKRGRPRKERNE